MVMRTTADTTKDITGDASDASSDSDDDSDADSEGEEEEEEGGKGKGKGKKGKGKGKKKKKKEKGSGMSVSEFAGIQVQVGRRHSVFCWPLSGWVGGWAVTALGSALL